MVTDAASLKREAAAAALTHVRSGMKLGLGTGSTAAVFVQLLAERLRLGELRDIETVSTSQATEALARSEGISCRTLAEVGRLDLTIDGADEIDEDLRLIKGRGGALLREKIVEQNSDRFIVIADESKRVARLGVGSLPIEVVRFATDLLFDRWSRAAIACSLRMSGEAPLLTDEGHHIIDVMVPPTGDIADFVASLRSQAGVVETGFFPNEATAAVLAGASGIVSLTRRPPS